MAKWKEVNMINRDEHSRLIAELVVAAAEIKRLQAENKELRQFLKKFREKTTSMFQKKKHLRNI